MQTNPPQFYLINLTSLDTGNLNLLSVYDAYATYTTYATSLKRQGGPTPPQTKFTLGDPHIYTLDQS